MKRIFTLLCFLFFFFLIGCGHVKIPLPGLPGPSPTPKPPEIAKTNVGRDILGIGAPGYSLQFFIDSLNAVNRKIPTGSVMDAFVNKNAGPGRYQKWIDLFKSGWTYFHRAHGIDNTCVRNGTCWAGSILQGYNLARVEKEARDPGSALSRAACAQAGFVVEWQKTFKDIEFAFSPLLEHNLTRDAAHILLMTVHACAPSLQLVDNPVTKYAKITTFLNECHGKSSGCDIVSLDGNAAENVDLVSWINANAAAKMIGIWIPGDNGRVVDEDPKVKPPTPPTRTHFPTRDQFFWTARMILPQAPKPQISVPWCPAPLNMDASHLYKNFAEDKGTGDGRANKPMLIVPTKAANMTIYDFKGAPALTLGYYGTYSGGGHRYYSALGGNLTSYQLGQKLEAVGSEWGLLREGNQCRWINGYRRSGSYK